MHDMRSAPCPWRACHALALSSFTPAVSEAGLMDPQQRILLEETSAAFRSAGHTSDTLLGSPTGVFVGCIWLEYGKQLVAAGSPAGAYMVTGRDWGFLGQCPAGRCVAVRQRPATKYRVPSLADRAERRSMRTNCLLPGAN